MQISAILHMHIYTQYTNTCTHTLQLQTLQIMCLCSYKLFMIFLGALEMLTKVPTHVTNVFYIVVLKFQTKFLTFLSSGIINLLSNGVLPQQCTSQLMLDLETHYRREIYNSQTHCKIVHFFIIKHPCALVHNLHYFVLQPREY